MLGVSWTAVSEGVIAEALGSLAAMAVVTAGALLRKRLRRDTRQHPANILDDAENRHGAEQGPC